MTYFEMLLNDLVDDCLNESAVRHTPLRLLDNWYEELRRAVEAKDYRKVRSLVLSRVDESERVSV